MTERKVNETRLLAYKIYIARAGNPIAYQAFINCDIQVKMAFTDAEKFIKYSYRYVADKKREMGAE